VSVVEGVRTLVDEGGESSGGGVKMGVAVLRAEEGVVRLLALVIVKGGRRWVVQARIAGPAWVGGSAGSAAEPVGDFEEYDWVAVWEQAIVIDAEVEIAQKVVFGDNTAVVEGADD
jgi:hypothetical protein